VVFLFLDTIPNSGEGWGGGMFLLYYSHMRYVPLIIISASLFLLLSWSFFISNTNAQGTAGCSTAEECREKISEYTKSIELLNQKKVEFTQQLQTIASQKTTLQKAINAVEIERRKVVNDVDITNKKLQKTVLTLSQIKESIGIAGNHIDLHRATIAYDLRELHQFDERSLIDIIFSDKRLSDLFQELNHTEQLNARVGERITELRFVRANLGEKQNLYESEQQQLEDLKQQVLDKKKIIEGQKAQQSQLLRETQSSEAKYQTLLAENEALRRAFEQELADYEATLKFVLDPTALPKPGSAPLSWPTSAPVIITQLFQARTGPHSGTTFGHTGTDFRAVYEPVYAMADGVIGGTGDTDVACKAVSFGKWILLRFDNHLAATYAHLSVISVSTGQKVKRGQLVGYSGHTGRSTAPHLHITLYADIDADGKQVVNVLGQESKVCKGKMLVQPRAATEAYLDPLLYLPKTTKGMFKAGIKED